MSSDSLSRGLNLEGLPFVLSYDAPPKLTLYVHRIGRTARAGKEGHALTFLEKQEARHFKDMVRPILKQHQSLKKWGGRYGGHWAEWLPTEDAQEEWQTALEDILAQIKDEE